MIPVLDRTHDPAGRSWVESAQQVGGDFPLQNLPFGVFRPRGRLESARIGVAIGDRVLDLARCVGCGLLEGMEAEILDAAGASTLNPLMTLGRPAARALRERLFDVLRDPSPLPRPPQDALVSQAGAELLLPVVIGDYTDFYSSIHHATNVGQMFRPDQPLFPNYPYVPIAYHGRSSSIVVSGTPVRRPRGQTKEDAAPAPGFGPTRSLDYECEVGAYVAEGNPQGTVVPLEQAERLLFGICLLNDWSARDIQRWEYQPLGPFLAKNFGTSVSPWVVTFDALAPFRVPAAARSAAAAEPLPYLAHDRDRRAGGIDLTLDVYLLTERMQEAGIPPARLSSASFTAMYWTLGQLLTHHASNGCNLRSGDLIGSGTVSGPAKANRGCLLELTWKGSEPVALPSGETRRFLEDGDEVILRGYCERPGFTRIGLGECRGTILPA